MICTLAMNKIIDSNNNDNFEILFWKVINNKFLFKLIFHQITSQIMSNRSVDEYHHSYTRDYFVKDYFDNRIKFKNITSLMWMVQNNQIQLLLCKLKNCEFIKVRKESLGELTNYFNEKIVEISTSTISSSTTETANTNTVSLESLESLFKEILILLLNNKLLNNEGHLRELLTSNEPTFKYILQVFDQTHLKLSKTFKNNLIYEILNYNCHSIEKLLKYKKLYNTPQTSINKQQQQLVKKIEIGSNQLKEVSMSTKYKLIELGFIDFGNDQQEFNEKFHNLNNGSSSKNEKEKEILKLLSIYISTSDWFPIYYSKYQEPIDELINNSDSIIFILKYTVLKFDFKLLKWCLLNELGNGRIVFEECHPIKVIDFQKDNDFINLYISQDKIHCYSNDFSILKSIDSIEKYSTIISSTSLSNGFKKLLPKSWNEIIPLLCNFKDNDNYIGKHYVLIDQIETIDWIIENQDYMSMNPISFIINSFQIAQYTISKIFINTRLERNKIINLNFKIVNGHHRDSNDECFCQDHSKSIIYMQSLLKSINECDIESLKFLNENGITIDWGIIHSDSLKNSISFNSNMDESLLINLIDYLNFIGYNIFNGSLFISFIESIKTTWSSKSFIYERIKVPTQYMDLINQTCDYHSYCEEADDLKVLLNENNPIEILEIISNEIDGQLEYGNLERIFNYGRGSEYYIKRIGILIEFYNATMKTNQQDILLGCKSAIYSLFSSLISNKNLSIDILIQIYDEIENSGIAIDHSFYHSIYYLAQKSPILMVYLMEFYKIGKLKKNEYYKEAFEQLEPHLGNGSIYTFDLVFKNSTNDELLDQLMKQSLSIAVEPKANNYNDNVNDAGFYSKVLNLNLNFLLSLNKTNSFFSTLNSIQQQLINCEIEIGNIGCGSFPNKTQNYKIDQNYEHEIETGKRFRKYIVKFYNNREIWYDICGQSFDRFWAFFDLIGLSTLKYFERLKFCQSKKPQFIYSIKILNELCFGPFYKYKDESFYLNEVKNEEIEVKKLKKKVKEINKYQNKYLILNQYIDKEEEELKQEKEKEKEVEKEKISNYSLVKHGFYKCSCDCNNGLNEIINGRIFYFSVQVYHNAIKRMNENEFNEFIKFCSYRSFIHFLYSYGIKVKYLFRYYDLINHVLLNHNHRFKNNNQIDKNIEFISNYWDSVFKYYPLKQKTIVGYELMMKSNKINSPILIELLSNYKLKYNDQYYHYDFKHNRELCINDMGDGFNE